MLAANQLQGGPEAEDVEAFDLPTGLQNEDHEGQRRALGLPDQALFTEEIHKPWPFQLAGSDFLLARRSVCYAYRLQTEDEHQGLVDGAQLARVQASGRPTEPFGVDDRRLLDEDTRLVSVERDLRSEACRAGTRGGR